MTTSMARLLTRAARSGVIIFTLFFTCAIAIAQVQTGSIAGTVRDNTGAVIPNANITVKNLGTGATRSATSGPNGGYIVPALPPANYEVTIASGNFSPFKQNVQVTVGGFSTIDATLGLAAASTTVEVNAQEAGVEVNTETQEVSQIVTPAQVAQLPSLTRNPYDFVGIAGNVSGGDRAMSSSNPQLVGSGQNNTDRGVGYSINGQRASGTEILLDGVENTNIFDTTIALWIPQDAVQEFRVVTNNFEPQYGRAAGGVVNLTSKTGTNTFHGSAWDFNRLSAYTANTYDNAAHGIPKSPYTRNEFGYTFGGPAIKDKLFFFQSTEWLRVRSNATLLGYVPTPQLLALTDPSVQAYFAKYGTPAPAFNSTVPASALQPTGGAFDNIPGNTPAFGLAQYTAPADAGGDLPQNTYTLVGRADYNLNNNTQMFFRFGRESLDAFAGTAFTSPYQQYNVGTTIDNNSYLYSLTHSFSQNVLSNTRISFFRDNFATPYNTALTNTPTLFLRNGAAINGQPVTLPGFFDASTGVGGLPVGGPQNSLQFNEDVSWVRGSHNMRFGGQLNYIQLNRAFGAFGQANDLLGANINQGLNNLITGTLVNFQVAVDPHGALPCQADPLHPSPTDPDHLIQTPQCEVTLPTTSPGFARSDRYRDWALYAQDSWKLTPRLTVNYGVRYEFYGVQHNNNQNLDSNFYYGQGANYFQQVRNGSMQIAPKSSVGGLWNPRYGTVGPRIGFAYDVFGNGSTALRGGWGISYERNFGNVTFNTIQNPPAYATPQIRNLQGIPLDNLGPFAGSGAPVALFPTSPRNVDQNINIAQTQFYSLSLERKLGAGSVLALEYNGAHGVHLYDVKNINELGGGQVYLGDPTNDSNTCFNSYGIQSGVDPGGNPIGPCFTRPNQQWTSINNRGTSGFSHYNGLNVRFQTQNIHNTGIMIVTNYTYSHSLDNISSTFSESSSGSNGVGNLGYLDPRNPALDHGNSDFDIRHRVAFSAVWTEPFFKGRRDAFAQAAGGWIVSPIFTARTGVPFTIADSFNSLNAGTGTGIPRYTPSSPISNFGVGSGVAAGQNSFTLLTLPAPNNFTGDLGISDFGPYPALMTDRNAFRGPGAWDFDLAVSKNFKLTERLGLEFRAEGFNLFNHHDMFVNGFANDAAGFVGAPLTVEGKKGGLGALATGGEHDERRFGQFALRLTF
jgi:Carboxypeptidase regulatory-like domain